MIALKVHRIGEALGAVVPEEALARLRVAEGDTVFLTETPDGGYRLISHDPEFERQMAIAEDGMDAYRETLRVLAL